jgi:hypothetical protein
VVKVKKLNHKGSQSSSQRNTKEEININYFFNSPREFNLACRFSWTGKGIKIKIRILINPSGILDIFEKKLT